MPNYELRAFNAQGQRLSDYRFEYPNITDYHYADTYGASDDLSLIMWCTGAGAGYKSGERYDETRGRWVRNRIAYWEIHETTTGTLVRSLLRYSGTSHREMIRHRDDLSNRYQVIALDANGNRLRFRHPGDVVWCDFVTETNDLGQVRNLGAVTSLRSGWLAKSPADYPNAWVRRDIASLEVLTLPVA